jgi:hypothetical protein
VDATTPPPRIEGGATLALDNFADTPPSTAIAKTPERHASNRDRTNTTRYTL